MSSASGPRFAARLRILHWGDLGLPRQPELGCSPFQRPRWGRLISWPLAIQVGHSPDILVVGLGGEKHTFAREKQAVTLVPVGPFNSIQWPLASIPDGLDRELQDACSADSRILDAFKALDKAVGLSSIELDPNFRAIC